MEKLNATAVQPLTSSPSPDAEKPPAALAAAWCCIAALSRVGTCAAMAVGDDAPPRSATASSYCCISTGLQERPALAPAACCEANRANRRSRAASSSRAKDSRAGPRHARICCVFHATTSARALHRVHVYFLDLRLTCGNQRGCFKVVSVLKQLRRGLKKWTIVSKW
jgi:hypothetical protein